MPVSILSARDNTRDARIHWLAEWVQLSGHQKCRVWRSVSVKNREIQVST